MHPQSVELLEVLQKTMIAANYSNRSIPTYTREIRYVCAYYPDLSPHQWTDTHIIDYMSYLKLVHKVYQNRYRPKARKIFTISGFLVWAFWLSLYVLAPVVFSYYVFYFFVF